MELIKEFKDRLKQALEIRGMKASELSEKTNVNKSTISQYLNGVYEPKRERIELFADVLNVDYAWLTGYDVPMIKRIAAKSEKPDIENYELNEYQRAEYEKIVNMNMLMFNGKKLPEGTKKKLQAALKEVFIEVLEEERKKEGR